MALAQWRTIKKIPMKHFAICVALILTMVLRASAQTVQSKDPPVWTRIVKKEVTVAQAWKDKELTLPIAAQIVDRYDFPDRDLRFELLRFMANQAWEQVTPPRDKSSSLNFQVRKNVGVALREAGDRRAIELFLRLVLDAAPATETAAAYYGLAESYQRFGMTSDYAQTLLLAVPHIAAEHVSWRATTLLYAKRAYQQLGDLDEVRGLEARILALDSGWENGFLMRSKASELWSKQQLEAGYAVLKTPVTGKDAEHAQLHNWNLLVGRCIQDGLLDDAETYARKNQALFEKLKAAPDFDKIDPGRGIPRAGERTLELLQQIEARRKTEKTNPQEKP